MNYNNKINSFLRKEKKKSEITSLLLNRKKKSLGGWGCFDFFSLVY
jgi:hypothetical protein